MESLKKAIQNKCLAVKKITTLPLFEDNPVDIISFLYLFLHRHNFQEGKIIILQGINTLLKTPRYNDPTSRGHICLTRMQASIEEYIFKYKLAFEQTIEIIELVLHAVKTIFYMAAEINTHEGGLFTRLMAGFTALCLREIKNKFYPSLDFPKQTDLLYSNFIRPPLYR